MRRVAIAYLFLLLVSVLQTAYYYQGLSGTVASHFNTAGKPDGWMSKGVSAGFDIGAILLIAMIFLGIEFMIPRIPDSLVNLPTNLPRY